MDEIETFALFFVILFIAAFLGGIIWVFTSYERDRSKRIEGIDKEYEQLSIEYSRNRLNEMVKREIVNFIKSNEKVIIEIPGFKVETLEGKWSDKP